LVLLVATWFKKYRLVVASALIVVGGLCQFYVIIIGAQLQPMWLFPANWAGNGSHFQITYSASLPEVVLSLGGIFLALLILLIGTKILRLLPK